MADGPRRFHCKVRSWLCAWGQCHNKSPFIISIGTQWKLMVSHTFQPWEPPSPRKDSQVLTERGLNGPQSQSRCGSEEPCSYLKQHSNGRDNRLIQIIKEQIFLSTEPNIIQIQDQQLSYHLLPRDLSWFPWSITNVRTCDRYKEAFHLHRELATEPSVI
jgi:hypothetical protein